MGRRACLVALVASFALCDPLPAAAQTALSGATLRIARIRAPIVVDGQLSDEGWKGVAQVDTWFETNPGDNLPPRVRSVGYLGYDDRFFYAAFEFDDPNPSLIRAPLGDRDNVPGFTDYGGVILDARNDGHSAMMMLVNPRGVQYDAINDDASGEDSSPDFFWDSAARITAKGWTLEIRIPFATLRYRNIDPQTWGILLYRNYPRESRYQFFSSRLPRGGNCFICRSNTLTGLERLPGGGHLVVAPFATAARASHPAGGLGTPLEADPLEATGGFDVKWTPDAQNAADFTVNPDFSQIESDTAQISTNERFALFFPEKRPFFLEGVNLLRTPIQAVYTRTVTDPNWGARSTGKAAGLAYTALITRDAGGGTAIVPGAEGSTLANEDFPTLVLIARVKKEIARSFVSMLVTAHEGGDNGHNRVLGPDFEWRAGEHDTVRGQWLASETQTPNKPDLASEWTGQSFASSAGHLEWGHNTTHFDSYLQYRDFGEGFRADAGFIPQVGYRDLFGGTGWTFRPDNFLTRLRTFLNVDRQLDRQGALLERSVQPGAGMDTRWSGFMQFRYIDDSIRTSGQLVQRHQFGYFVQFSPSRQISQIAVNGNLGQDIDFANARPGRGARINLSANLHPTNHLELQLIENHQWLNVDDQSGSSRRLFTARVSRVRTTYSFTARSFARVIAQYVSSERDPSLYSGTVSVRSAAFTSSILFAYKLNWQSVLFVGYGDDRELTDASRLVPSARQAFVKVSYAIQR